MVIFNDKAYTDKKNLFNASNRAFRYGDGLFETIRVMDGKPLFLTDHFKRFINGLKILKIVIDKSWTEEWFIEKIRHIININNIQQGGKIRFSVFRNDGGFYTPSVNSASHLLEAAKLDENTYTLDKNGLNIGVYNELKKPVNLLSGFKTINSQLYVLAGIFKNENGFDDCLIVNEKGNICEAISSNIFIIIKGKIYTPPLSEGCVDGVFKKQIINSFDVIKRPLTIHHLKQADEVFLTNTIGGIRWVGVFNEKLYDKKMAEDIGNKINAMNG